LGPGPSTFVSYLIFDPISLRFDLNGDFGKKILGPGPEL